MRPARQLKLVDFDQNRRIMRYAPTPIRTLEDLQGAMKNIIGKRAGSMKPNESRSFVTFGSCFAINLGEALLNQGAKVYTTRVTEDINSPFNNRILLRHIFLGEQGSFIDELLANTGLDSKEVRKELTQATDIVITLGNIFHVEGEEGHVLLSNKSRWLVRESFEETQACIKEIISLLTEHTKARIFVSVSPIPISGYIGTEFSSAIEADCASKSQLVAATRTLEGFTYIPTFEIFRWLPAHQDFPSFGAGRDNPRHLWGRHVGMVMGVLCQ